MIPWDDIDPEIRDLVRIFNDAGIETHGCCSGHRGARDRKRGQSSGYAYVMFSVRGLAALHRFVAALNAVQRTTDLQLDVRLNWDEEVNASLDPGDPERLPFDLEISDLNGKRRAPTAGQLAHIAAAFEELQPPKA